MTTSLVPYSGSHLCPKDAREVTLVTSLPGPLDYSGTVVVALTDNALWIVAPDGEHVMIPFANIQRVRSDNFPGVVYIDSIDGVSVVVAPNDTAGVTIEYSTVGKLVNSVSFLTHLANKALAWASKIQRSVADYNLRNYMDTPKRK